jgi:hypothetical protein
MDLIKRFAMSLCNQAPAFLFNRLRLLLLLSASLLSACGSGSGGVSSGDTLNNDPNPSLDLSPESRAEALNRYQFANGCYTFQSQKQFLVADGDVYGLTNNANQATAFYKKPTDLGRYLLLSDYQRDLGELGSKQLLGISDPAGEILDESGNFVGELSYLVSGLGYILNLVLDPVAPIGGLLRNLGENLDGIGTNLSDRNIQPSLAIVADANDLAVWNSMRQSQLTVLLII